MLQINSVELVVLTRVRAYCTAMMLPALPRSFSVLCRFATF